MPDPSSLVIVGAGGFGREVAALVESNADRDPNWDLKGFVDDNADLHGTSVMGHTVLGGVDWLSRQTDVSFVVAVGDGRDRQHIAERLVDADVSATPLVAPSVSVHRTTTVEPGSILCAGAAPTVNVHVGAHTVLDQQCTVGHDTTLDAFVTLHPGVHVSGSVHLEAGVTMGAGAVVLPGTHIGAHTTVGAGAVVTDDLPAGCTAVGVPARPLS